MEQEVVDETTKISSAKQNTFTEFTVTMSKALEKVAASDFTMVRDDDNQVITIKSAALDATDKTQSRAKVTVTYHTYKYDSTTNFFPLKCRLFIPQFAYVTVSPYMIMIRNFVEKKRCLVRNSASFV